MSDDQSLENSPREEQCSLNRSLQNDKVNFI